MVLVTTPIDVDSFDNNGWISTYPPWQYGDTIEVNTDDFDNAWWLSTLPPWQLDFEQGDVYWIDEFDNPDYISGLPFIYLIFNGETWEYVGTAFKFDGEVWDFGD